MTELNVCKEKLAIATKALETLATEFTFQAFEIQRAVRDKCKEALDRIAAIDNPGGKEPRRQPAKPRKLPRR